MLFCVDCTLKDLVSLSKPCLDHFVSYFIHFQPEDDSIHLHYRNIMRITFSKWERLPTLVVALT